MTVTENYVGCHWWTGSFAKENLKIVVSMVERFCTTVLWKNITWDEKPGLNGYQKSLRYSDEIFLNFDVDAEFFERVHNNRCSITFTGKFFDSMPFDRLPDFADMVDMFSCSRFDVYFQDVSRKVSVFDIYTAYKRGCVRGFKAYRYIESGSGGESKGETFEMGHRGSQGSGKFLRIYDKELESGGEIQGIRWEMEWSDKRARSAWDLWKNAGFSASFCAGLVFSAVDFIEPSNDHHRRRWRRLGWYQELIDGMDEAHVPVERVKTDIERKDRWMTISVSGTLAYMRAFLYFTGRQDAFETQMNTYLRTGREKLKKKHYEQLQRDIEKYMPEDDPFGPPDIYQIKEFLGEVAA